jgi:hypothetical protein
MHKKFLFFNLLADSDGLTLDVGEAAKDVLPYADTVVNEGAGQGAANLISGFLEITLFLGGILVLLYLIWGAIDWITAGGEKGKIEEARKKITQAIIGLLMLSASIAIFNMVQHFLNVTLIDFGGFGS